MTISLSAKNTACIFFWMNVSIYCFHVTLKRFSATFLYLSYLLFHLNRAVFRARELKPHVSAIKTKPKVCHIKTLFHFKLCFEHIKLTIS